MRSLLFVARSEVRRRVWSLIALTIIVGLAGGIAASLIAGSRRSSSVVDRYFAAGIRYDLSVGTEAASRDQLLAMPGVLRADPSAYVGLMHQESRDGINGFAIDPASVDPTIELLAGRMLRSGQPEPEVVVNARFVKGFGLGVGDTINAQAFSEDDQPNVEAGKYEPTGPRYRFRIAGVVRTPDDIAGDEIRAPGRSAYGSTNSMMIPFDWYAAHSHEFLTFPGVYDVQLRNPARDREAFLAALSQAAGGNAAVHIDTPRFSERRASFDTPVDAETLVLLGLGLVVAFVGAIVVTLLLRAEQRAHSAEEPVLAALGTTRSERGAIAALRVLPVAAGGAILAVVVGYALSDRYPVGIGNILELHRGRRANLVVLGATALASFVIVTGVAYALGRRGTRAERHAKTRGNIVDRLAGAGAPTDLVVGTQLAFQRGSTLSGVPARQAVFGGAAALVLIAAVGVVVAGVDNLYTSPRAHGWPWDAMVGNVNFTMPKPNLKRLLADPRLTARSRARYGQATVGDRSTEVLVIDPADTAPPVVLSGRLPTAPTEIALGVKLAQHLHADLGSKVRFSVKGGEFELEHTKPRDLDLTVVGLALPPILGESDIGETGIMTFDAVLAAGGNTDPSFVLVRFGNAPRAATARALQRDYTSEVVYDAVPARIVNLHEVRELPLLGALLAALLGTVLLVYTLAVSVRTRTRELGVLRAIGMSSRRLGRVLACEGLMLALTMSLLGLPIGIVLGAFSWRTIAHQLGVAEDLTFPIAIVLLIPAAIAIGLLAALVPARNVRRNTVANLLRVE